MGVTNWNGPALQAAVRQEMQARISAACIHLTNVIKADISQAGTLRYNPTLKSGKASKRQKTIYNFSHSRPGNPPYKQTGHLRRSMTWEVSGMVGRVGTNLVYGRHLELGTSKMAPRPFIRSNFLKNVSLIRRMIAAPLKPGTLPAVVSNQSRSGHLGRGAAGTGYDVP